MAIITETGKFDVTPLTLQRLKKSLAEVPEKYKEQQELELRFFHRPDGGISINDYIILLQCGFIDTNDKCNRIDRDDHGKKEGILNVVFKGGGLPDLSLCWKWDKKKNEWYLAVNDGGHRSRTFLEFVDWKSNNPLKTGPDCYFYNNMGKKVFIPNMTFRETLEDYPEAIEKFLEYNLSLCLNWNLGAIERKEDYDDRNKSSKLDPPEFRNAYDENVLADWVKFTVKKMDHPDAEDYTIHPLFNPKIIGFKNTKMCYDDILAKIFSISYNGSCFTDHSPEELDKLYHAGSYAATDRGEFIKFPKVFEKAENNAIEICDFLFGVLSNWPSKNVVVKKNFALIWALTRFYVEYKNAIKKKNATLIWNNKIAIDYKIFAKKFYELFKTLDNDEETDIFVAEKKPRMKGEAFGGYLADFKNIKKIKKSVEWIMDIFPEDEREFGITLYDSREVFSNEVKYAAWLANDRKDAFGNPIEFEDVQGDHDIPRSWGIRAGGVTEPSNLKLLNEEDNAEKSNHMTFEDFKALKKAA